MDIRMRVAERLAQRLGKEEGLIGGLLEIPPDETFGDYALPCFSFAKEERKAPNKIAEEFATRIPSTGIIERVAATGPYLNLFLNRAMIIRDVVTTVLNEQGRYGAGEKKPGKVMIEYSQPNTHKAFHVGHLRGTSIGEALARILRHAGNEVVQANYSGDTGMHVAKWLWCYTAFHKDERPPEEERAKARWLAGIYVEAVQRLEKEPERDAEVRELNRRLDEGRDETLLRLWKETRQWSIDEFEAIYEDLQAHFDVWWFEREFDRRAKEVSKELLRRGIATESDGATIIDLEDEELGVWVLLREDGTPLYSAKDLALAEKKFNDYAITRSIYVVGKAQALHLQQLFATLRRIGFRHAGRCFHLRYEEVRLPEGKMSSRSGQNILYADLKEAVFAHTEREIRSRHAEWSDERIAAAVQAVGVCALKFEMILRDQNKPIVFDAAKVCDFEGDTGPYLQYTHARCNSILKKLGMKPDGTKAEYAKLTSLSEYRLARRVNGFPAVIETVERTLSPSEVARYALELAKACNTFYHECPVIGQEESVTHRRALIVDAARIVLERCLFLLGIEAPKEM